MTGAQVAGAESAAPLTSETGSLLPFSGASEFEVLAPTQFTDAGQINEPIGQQRADEIAQQLRLDKDKVLTEKSH